MMKVSQAILLLLPLLSANVAIAQQTWASLKGKFVFDGEIPKQKYIDVSDQLKTLYGFPKDYRVVDDRLMIDPDTRGITNILIYAAPELSDPKRVMPVHPGDAQAVVPQHVLTLENLVLTPRITYMRTNQTLVMANPYSILQFFSVQVPSARMVRFKAKAGGRATHVMKQQTSSPAELGSGINKGYDSWVLVRDNNYVDLTNTKGEFEIKNLPLGSWPFVAWVERSPKQLLVNFSGKEEKWIKGEFIVTVNKGGTDLGEIRVSQKNFE